MCKIVDLMRNRFFRASQRQKSHIFDQNFQNRFLPPKTWSNTHFWGRNRVQWQKLGIRVRDGCTFHGSLTTDFRDLKIFPYTWALYLPIIGYSKIEKSYSQRVFNRFWRSFFYSISTPREKDEEKIAKSIVCKIVVLMRNRFFRASYRQKGLFLTKIFKIDFYL